MLRCDWHKSKQPDFLANHDSEVFDGEFVEGFASKSMARLNQMRIETRFAPIVLLQFL
jgi:hypothetical protein